MKENKEFIKQIVSNHKAIKTVISVKKRLAIWFISIILFSLFALNFNILRDDLSILMLDFKFALASLSLLGSSISLAYLALLLGNPGKNLTHSKNLIYLNLLLLLVALSLTFYLHPKPFSQSKLISSIHCSSSLIFISLVPGFILYLLMRVASVQDSLLASFVLFLAAGSFAAFILQMSCLADSPMHVFLYHLLPILLLGSIGIVTAKKLF